MNIFVKKTQKNLKPSGTTALDSYKKNTAKKVLFLLILAVAIFLLGSIAITIGPLDISVKEAYQVIGNKIFPSLIASPDALTVSAVWLARIPRYLAGVLIGCSLAISGAVMQPVLRNPMASPFTLGISSGAGFGASLAIILGWSIGGNTLFLVANAFIFSMITSVVILLQSRKKNMTPATMILTGVAISYFFSAGTTLLEYFGDAHATQRVVFWLMGSLSKGTWDTLKYIFPPFIICVPYMIYKSWDLNSVSVGDDTAKTLGINVKRTRLSLMIMSSFLTAAVICFTGTIGFVGLVAPHITRIIIGSDNRFVIPASGLLGAFMLAASDVVAMNVLAPMIIPIGVMTSILGVPLFVYLIQRIKGGGY